MIFKGFRGRLILAVSILLFVNLVILGYFSFTSGQPKGELRVIFFDIGQGDSALIQTPRRQNILIDGGPDRSLIFKLDKYIPLTARKIDLMILTHPDPDHLYGFVEVLRHWQVGKVAYTGTDDNYPFYLEWLKLIKEKEIPTMIITRPQILKLGDEISLEFLWPIENLKGKSFRDNNPTSIVNKLVFNKVKFLFTGDIDKGVESKLIELGADLKADVLKVGHHGSKYSSGLEFLKKVGAFYGVISVGKDNTFGHPSFRVLKNLEKAGYKILRTDEMGDIIFITNGEELKLKSKILNLL